MLKRARNMLRLAKYVRKQRKSGYAVFRILTTDEQLIISTEKKNTGFGDTIRINY